MSVVSASTGAAVGSCASAVPGAASGGALADDRPASSSPPGGLAPRAVPMLVSIGWDDNGQSGLPGSGATGGIEWALRATQARRNRDGSPVRTTYFVSSMYARKSVQESPTFVKRAWHALLLAGNEIGNHSDTHPHGSAFGVAEWSREIETCLDVVARPFDAGEHAEAPDPSSGIGLARERVFGFRTPFLEYGDATFGAVAAHGFRYDCSIEEGFQESQDGTNYVWPYTLDHGSPGHDVQVSWGQKPRLTAHPGLWELPVYALVAPPDELAGRYGIAPGLRKKLKIAQSYFDESSGKITGLDWNLWVEFRMTKAEFLATLEHSFDLRLAGNRAPFLFGAHSDLYSSRPSDVPNATPAERREAIEEFLDYVLARPEVRVVTMKQVLDWLTNPVPLGPAAASVPPAAGNRAFGAPRCARGRAFGAPLRAVNSSHALT